MKCKYLCLQSLRVRSSTAKKFFDKNVCSSECGDVIDHHISAFVAVNCDQLVIVSNRATFFFPSLEFSYIKLLNPDIKSLRHGINILECTPIVNVGIQFVSRFRIVYRVAYRPVLCSSSLFCQRGVD